MEKYIVITEFGEQQDIKVETISCKNENNLLHCWARKISYPRIGIKSKQRLLQDVIFHLRELSGLVLVKDTQNLYTDFYSTNGIFIVVYAIRIKRVIDSLNNYTILAFYKNWDFTEERNFVSPFDALADCLNIIHWQDFSQEEKHEFEKVLKSTNNVNCIIRNLVWNFECSIFGNKLKVYIVKS